MERVFWGFAAFFGVICGALAIVGAFVWEIDPLLKNVAFAVGVLLFGTSGTVAATVLDGD